MDTRAHYDALCRKTYSTWSLWDSAKRCAGRWQDWLPEEREEIGQRMATYYAAKQAQEAYAAEHPEVLKKVRKAKK